LQAAVEGVSDAAADRMAAQGVQYGVDGAPAVQDYGQLEFTGELQLGSEELRLLGFVGLGNVEVQADFADCNGPLLLQVMAQLLQITAVALGEIERMNAVRRVWRRGWWRRRISGAENRRR